MTYDTNNIFAKISRDEIPAARVYEDNNVIAFMDAMPQGLGHTLVIPRQPCRNLLDADPQTLQKTIIVVQKIANAVKTAFQADGVSIMQFNEEAGGQSVFHLHFHIIPRFHGVDLKKHHGAPEERTILEENAAQIRIALQ